MLTYTLMALLLYPGGVYKEIDLGTTHSYAECKTWEQRTSTQLQGTLSTAQLIAVMCKREINT